MLKSGFSVVGEFQYLHHQPDGSPYDEPAELSLRCLAAAEEAGIAITMLPTLYAYGGFGGQAPVAGQRRFINDADRFLDIYATLESGLPRQSAAPAWHLAAFSLRAVTHGTSDKPCWTALRDDAPIHIHVAEQTKEVDDCLAWSGKRPVEYLLDHFDVSAAGAPSMRPI